MDSREERVALIDRLIDRAKAHQVAVEYGDNAAKQDAYQALERARTEALSPDEALEQRLLEAEMRAHKWMQAHDKLAAGKPYEFPKPADLPDALAANERLIEALREVRIYVEEKADDTYSDREDTLLERIDAALGSTTKAERT